MGNLLQVALGLPYISRRQTPIVVLQISQICTGEPGQAGRIVYVGVEVTHDQIAETAKDRLAAVEPDVTRASNRAKCAVLLIEKDYMVQQVFGFHADDERGVAVLLQNGGREDSSFE